MGYEAYTCSGQCSSSNALNDLHHRFASEAEAEQAREFPLNFVEFDSVNRFKNSLLFGSCEELTCKEWSFSNDSSIIQANFTQTQLRATVEWGIDSELFEPARDVRGDIARAILYMSVRYDGGLNDGVSDLELTDFHKDQDPRCCFDGGDSQDDEKGCIREKCEMGQLSTILEWHLLDPPDEFETQRNEKVQRFQGNRNVFVDHPQLVWLLFNPNGSTETFSDCGEDNSTIKQATWNSIKSELTFTIKTAAEANQPIHVRVSSSSGIHLPSNGMIQNSDTLMVYANLSGIVTIPQNGNIRSPAVGAFVSYPLILFYTPLPDEESDIFVALNLNYDLNAGDVLTLFLPGFGGGSMFLDVIDLICDESFDVGNCHDTSCLQGCREETETQTRFNASFSSTSKSNIVIDVINYWAKGDVITMKLKSADINRGIIIPISGVSKLGHNITLQTRISGLISSIRFQVQAIGAFMGTPSITYSKKVPGGSIDFKISFTPAMRMSPSDSIFLSLPNFQIVNLQQRISVRNLTASSVLNSPQLLAVWTFSCFPVQTLLLIVRNGDFWPGYLYELDVNDMNIGLPFSALSTNQTSIMIGTDCADGPVAAETVQSDAIAYVKANSIAFSPALAGNKTNIFITLISEVDLEPDDFLYIHLQDFSGSSISCTQTVGVIPSDWCTSVGWNENLSEISLRISSYLSSGAFLQLTISSNAGIILPLTGVARNTGKLMLRADTNAGVMDYIDFDFVAPIGTFSTDPVLTFNPMLAGAVTQLSLTFAPAMEIQNGGMLTLTLLDFKSDLLPYSPAPEIRCFVSQGLEGLTWNGTWNSSASQLVIYLSNVAELSPVLIVIPTSAGIRIPDTGLNSNDDRLKISVNAAAGLITDHALDSRAIGTLMHSKISLLPTDPNRFLINVSFYPAMSLSNGDTFEICLGEFSLNVSDNSKLQFVSVPNATFSSPVWFSQNNSILLNVIATVHTHIQVQILLGPFPVTVPTVRTKEVSIAASVRQGALSPTVFEEIDGFGPYNPPPSIIFSPANAGSNTSISISFTFQVLSGVPYTASVSLPGFDLLSTRSNTACTYTMQPAVNSNLTVSPYTRYITYTEKLSGSSNIVGTRLYWTQSYLCHFNNSSLLSPCICFPHASVLNITLQQNISRTNLQQFLQVGIVVPQNQGILLPIQGTTKFSNGLQITIQGEIGNLKFNPVGYFLQTPQIDDFSEPSPGSATAIEFSFSLGTTLHAFEQIVLTLPGFTGYPSSILNFEGPSGQKFSGSWSPSDQKLVLFLNCIGSFVLPGEKIIVVAPSSLNIQIPSAGIGANSSILAISINGSEGSYGPTVFSRTPGVGLFETTSLSFLPPQAGGVCSVILKITPAMQILKDSFIYLVLPGFGGSNIVSSDVTSDGNTVSQANWTRISFSRITDSCTMQFNSTAPLICGSTLVISPKFWERVSLESNFIYLLTLSVSSDIPAGVQTAINVSASLKISLPIDGTEANSMLFTISTDTPNQPVKTPVPISRSPGIYITGYFFYCNITFGPSLPKMAGYPSDMVISFMPYMTFVDNDVVYFYLNNFTGRSFSNVGLNAAPTGLTVVGSWNSETQVLSVRFVSYVQSGSRKLSYLSLTAVTLTISKKLGIALPAGGIELNSPQLLVSTLALSGPFNPVPFTGNPVVYNIGHFVQTILTYDSMGFLCNNAFGGFAPPGLDPSKPLASTTCTENLLGQGRAGTNTSITFTFVPAMDMFPSDNITVNFKYWTAPSPITVIFIMCSESPLCHCNLESQNAVGICASQQYFRSGRFVYSADTLKFTFTVATFVPMNEKILIFLPFTLGLKIPVQGLRLNDQRISVETDAVAGPFPPTAVLKSDAVGSFGSSPSLSFGTVDYQSAGILTEIQFTFTPLMLINSYEKIIISLPDFVGADSSFNDATSVPNYCNPTISSLLGCGSLIQMGSWISNTHELILTLEGFATIPANQTVTVTIGTTAGIHTPVQGLASNQLTLTVQTNAASGPVPPTPITSSRHIGLFNEKADSFNLSCNLYGYCMFPFSTSANVLDRPLLSFDPAQASVSSMIRISINPILAKVNAPMNYSGFYIDLFLTAVRRSSGYTALVAIEGPFASNLVGSWSGNSISIQAHSQDLLVKRTGPIDMIIPVDAGFEVNNLGNVQNDPNNYVLIGMAGQTAKAVLASPAIGVFQLPLLTFYPGLVDSCTSEIFPKSFPCPGKPATLIFSFKTLISLYNGDLINLMLPLFESLSAKMISVSVVSNGIQDLVCPAIWNASSSVLSTKICGTITKMSLINIFVNSTYGIELPSCGVLQGSDFQYSAVAVMGNIIWTSFASSVTIPSVLSNFQVGILPTQPGKQVQLSVKFDLLSPTPTQTVLYPGDWIILELPGFTRDMGSNSSAEGTVFTEKLNGVLELAVNMTLFIQQPLSTFSQVVWYNSLSQLWLKVVAPVPLTEVGFVLSSNYGLRSPLGGLPSNDPSLQIAGYIKGVYVCPTSCTGSTAIGTVKSTINGGVIGSRMIIDSLGPNFPVAINLTFALILPLQPGETVNVTLPGFYRPLNDAPILVNSLPSICTDIGCHGKVLQVSWSEVTATLVLTFAQALEKRESITVFVEASSGIYAPPNGLVQNQNDLVISCLVFAGIIPPTPIETSSAIGFFLNVPVLSQVESSLVVQLALNQPVLSDTNLTLVLPDFRSRSSSAIYTAYIDGVCEKTFASWGSDSLNVTIPAQSFANSTINLRIPLGVDSLQLPLLGLQKYPLYPAYRAELAGSQTILVVDPPIGAVMCSSLEFDPPEVGPLVILSLKIVAAMYLQFNDFIYLKLPGFVGPAQSFTVVATVGATSALLDGPCSELQTPNVTSHAVDYASWDPISEVLTLPLTGSLAAGTPLLVVANSPTLQLPPRGILANDTSLTLAIVAAEGSVLSIPVQQTQGVGVILSSALFFGPYSRAGEIADITLIFVAAFDLLAGDNVVLALPEFKYSGSCLWPPCQLNLSKGWDFGFVASWNPANKTVAFSLLPSASTLRAGTQLQLEVAATGGIELPAVGVQVNQQALQLSAVTASVVVLPLCIQSINAVGSFGGSEQLTFLPPLAGAVAEITFSFRALFSLAMGESIELQLPGFTGNEDDSISTSSIPYDSIARAVWHNRTQTLILQVIRVVPARTYVIVTVSSSAKIAIPVAGLQQDHSGLMFSTSAVAGPIAPTQITQTQAIGVFSYSALAFDPPIADGQTSVRIKLNFTYARQAKAGEEFILQLPGFSLTTEKLILDETDRWLISSDNFSARAKWSQKFFALTIILVHNLPADAALNFTFDSFLLPIDGVCACDQRLSLATNASAGPVLPTPVGVIQPVGSLGNETALEWTPLRANAAAVLFLSLRPAMVLAEGELVMLTLPGWSGETGQLTVTSEPGGIFSSATWTSSSAKNNASRILILTVAKLVQGGTAISIASLGPDPGFSRVSLIQPANGTTTNQQSFLLSTTARAGPVLPTPVHHSPGVAVLLAAYVILRPVSTSILQAGDLAVLHFSFWVDRSLTAPADEVLLFLPGFSVDGCPPSAAGAPKCALSVALGINEQVAASAQADGGAMWDSNSSSIVFLAPKFVNNRSGPAYFGPLTVIGLRTPAFGVRGIAGHAGLTIFVRAAQGSSDGVAVMNVTALGAFASSPQTSLNFPPGLAGQPAALVLLAVPLFDIARGEALTLTLCGFGGLNVTIPSQMISGPSASLFQAQYTGANVTGSSTSCQCPSPDAGMADASVAGTSIAACKAPLLVLKAKTAISAYSALNLTISTAAGILLPKGGLLTAAEAAVVGGRPAVLLISSNAADGPVSGEPISLLEEYDALLTSSFSVSPRIAAAAVEINISFALVGPSKLGRRCVLTLPGFTRKSPFQTLVGDDVLDAFGAFAVSWSNAGPALSLTAVRDIDQGEDVQITISAENGIHVPVSGLPLSMSPGITLACLAVAGSSIATAGSGDLSGVLPPTRVVMQTPVGRFMPNSTVLVFSPPAAGKACNMAIRFVLSVNLQAGEEVVVGLPGFSLFTNDTFAVIELDNITDEAVNLTEARLAGISTPANTAVDSNQSALFPDAFWSQPSHSLTLTAAKAVHFGTPVFALVSATQGLLLPSLGVRAGGAGLTLAAAAAEGPVLPVAFDFVTSVGAFQNTALHFGAAVRAGDLVNATVSFSALMPLDYGDVVEVSPGQGFSLKVALEDYGTDPSSQPENFYISSETDGENLVIKLTLRHAVSAGAYVLVKLPGLRLPLSGVGPEQMPTISATASAGVASPSVFDFWQYVGSLSPATATFLFDGGNSASTAALGIEVRFQPSMQLTWGDEIIVGLPKFQARNKSRINVTCTGGAVLTTVVWWDIFSSAFVFSVQGVQNQVVGQSIECAVPPSLELQPPSEGFVAASASATAPVVGGLYIETDAAAGPVIPTALAATISIARILGGGVSFSPPTAGARCSVQLSFRSTGWFMAHDSVQFHLPFLELVEFVPTPGLGSGSASASALAVFFTDSADWSNATWDPVAQDLTLFASRAISGFAANVGGVLQSYNVLLAISTGLALVAEGTAPYSEAAWVRSRAATAPSLRDVLVVESVGAFNPALTRVDFYTESGILMPSQPAIMALHFVPYMRIEAGESINLRAPGFAVEKSKSLASSSPSGAVTVAWEVTTFTFTLSMAFSLDGGSLVSVLITGASLPALGVAPAAAAANHATAADGIYLSAKAIDGDVMDWPVQIVQSIGALVSSTLSYTRPVAGAVTGLQLSFAVSVALDSKTDVHLSLPGFTLGWQPPVSAETILPLPGGCDGCSACTWNNSQQIVILTLAVGYTPLATVDVTIPYGAGLILPSTGVGRDDARDITIAIPFSPGGPVPPMPVVSETVGAVLGSSLDYDPEIAGHPTAIQIKFAYSGKFNAADQV